MSRSPIMSNDISHRREFKENALKRVQAALSEMPEAVKPAPFAMKSVMVKGLDPKRKKGG